MRYLAVWYPEWPILAAGYDTSTPVAVIESGRVSHCSAAARQTGVQPGQRRREAKSYCPDLLVLSPNPLLNASAFDDVVDALMGVVPRLEVSEPGLCTLLADGPARYFGGEQELAAALHETMQELTYPPGRIGIADSRFAARLAASHGESGVFVPTGTTREFLAPLAINTLGLDELSAIAHQLGIYTLKQFAELPIRSVLTRFGTTAAIAHAHARGLNPEPLAIHEPPPECSTEVTLDPPAERVDIATFAAKGLSVSFIELMSRQGVGCTQLRIDAYTENSEHLARTWRASPVFDAAAIVERTRWQLSGWLENPQPSRHRASQPKPTAGISRLQFTAVAVAGVNDLQTSLWGELSHTDQQAIRALDRISGLLSAESVLTAIPHGGRFPQDRVDYVPWGQSPPANSGPMPWPGHIPEPHPSLIHRPPTPIDVHSEAGPVSVSARGSVNASPSRLRRPRQRWQSIVGWAGPWLADERWWEPATAQRVAHFQFLVESVDARNTTDGQNTTTAHLCSFSNGNWQLEGTYD